MVSKPICRDCVAEVQLFKWCQNLSAGTVLQGCSCLSGVENLSAGTVLQRCSCLSSVETYLPLLHAGMQLFKMCGNLSADNKLQECSCLSVVDTHLQRLCCRGGAVKVLSKPICWHSVAEVQLFKRCQNLPAGTVLQRCSCLSSVKTYLQALCCRGAAV